MPVALDKDRCVEMLVAIPITPPIEILASTHFLSLSQGWPSSRLPTA
jgi:hypothetical protein